MPKLEEAVGELLRARGLKLALAESCTGGLVADRITDVPGSSDYFLGGLVAYAYEAKTALLGIPREFLIQQGAVNEETARRMASAARERLGADVALGVTGIAGPSGGTPDKPVGLVYIALAAPDLERCERFVWNGDRVENKRLSADAALQMLKEYLERVAR